MDILKIIKKIKAKRTSEQFDKIKSHYKTRVDYVKTTIESIYEQYVLERFYNNEAGRVMAIEAFKTGLGQAGIEYGDIIIDEHQIFIQTFLPYLETIIII